jgi:ABC-type enterobactin transport system permease subunit
VGYAGMLVSIGIRQIPHFRRSPADIRRLPLFVLQLTFLMAPIRIAAFATMLHQGWATRGSASRFRVQVASMRWRMPPAPRLAAAFIVASVAVPGAMFVSASRVHSTGPGVSARDATGQEVILEAPSAEPPHR